MFITDNYKFSLTTFYLFHNIIRISSRRHIFAIAQKASCFQYSIRKFIFSALTTDFIGVFP